MIKKIKANTLWQYTFFTAVILGLCTHLPIMLSDIPNHDGLASIYFDQNMVVSGRWFLSVACGFSSYYSLPWIIGLLAILVLAVTAVLLTEVLEIKKISGGVMVAGLLVTFPVLTSTFAYVFTMDGYMLAVLLSVLAVYLVGKGKLGFLWGGIALAFSMGTYQAYLPTAILLCIYKVVLIFLEDREKNEKVKSTLNYLYMGVAGVVLYYVMLKVMLFVQGKEIGSYQVSDTGSGFSLGMIVDLYKDFVEFVLTGKVLVNNVFSILAFCVMGLLFVVTLGQICIRKKLYKSPWFYVILPVLCLVIPIASNAILLILPNVEYHTLMRYQYVIFLLVMIAFVQNHLKVKKKITPVILCVTAGVLIFNYVVTDNIAYSNLEKKYEKTYAYCVRLADRMEQTEGYYQGIPIAMIGVVSDNEYPTTDVTKDVTSKLLGITGDTLLYTGENYKAFFANYLGITINLIPIEDMTEIYNSKEYWEMESFPSANSMKVVDGILYIKTENQETVPYDEK